MDDILRKELDEIGDSLKFDTIPNISSIDIDGINSTAMGLASKIIEQLSGFYFSEEYIKKHPYLPVKIAGEVDHIRTLLKMMATNEKVSDMIVVGMSHDMTNASLTMALMRVQSTTLSIQKQLKDIIERLEHIFMKMQIDSGTTFGDSEKEEGNDGGHVVRGSRDFVLRCQMISDTKNKNYVATDGSYQGTLEL